MKITLLTHRFLPRYFGGVEIYSLRLAQAMQAQSHTVHILSALALIRVSARLC
jgi:hypothetical protein